MRMNMLGTFQNKIVRKAEKALDPNKLSDSRQQQKIDKEIARMMSQTDNAYFKKEPYEIEDEMDKLMVELNANDK